MKRIYIPQLLKEIDRQIKIEINDIVPNFISLTPVKGAMLVRHGGNFLEVVLKVETIVTLSCDRCLQQYNHRLSINTTEIIWLDDREVEWDLIGSDSEIELEDLLETLPPEGHFEPSEWLFEQLSLALPLRNLCDRNCQVTPAYQQSGRADIDKRWAGLNKFKTQLSDSPTKNLD
jgi:uncharacterized protein